MTVSIRIPMFPTAEGAALQLFLALVFISQVFHG